MNPLPRLMVAPNGARRSKREHPKLPVTQAEIVDTAIECFAAGATGLHLHVRNDVGSHVLDARRYREALAALADAVPDMQVQITTEAIGRYTATEQRNLVSKLRPASVSISIAEMCSDGDANSVTAFYRWCHESDIAVQHIVYDEADLKKLESNVIEQGADTNELQLLFVLGRYATDQQATPDDLAPFTCWLSRTGLAPDWAVCAFGRQETACLVAAHQLGGKLRVGFENSLWNSDGSLAASNAERIVDVQRGIREQNGAGH